MYVLYYICIFYTMYFCIITYTEINLIYNPCYIIYTLAKSKFRIQYSVSCIAANINAQV